MSNQNVLVSAQLSIFLRESLENPYFNYFSRKPVPPSATFCQIFSMALSFSKTFLCICFFNFQKGTWICLPVIEEKTIRNKTHSIPNQLKPAPDINLEQLFSTFCQLPIPLFCREVLTFFLTFMSDIYVCDISLG